MGNGLCRILVPVINMSPDGLETGGGPSRTLALPSQNNSYGYRRPRAGRNEQ